MVVMGAVARAPTAVAARSPPMAEPPMPQTTTPRAKSRALMLAESTRHCASSYWRGCARTSSSMLLGSASSGRVNPGSRFQGRPLRHDGAVADNGALHARAGADPGARTDDRFADHGVGSHDHAVEQDRALDRRVRADVAVRSEHRLRADVRAGGDRTVVDERSSLVALGQRRLDAAGEQVPRRFEIALGRPDVDPVALAVPGVEALPHHLRKDLA